MYKENRLQENETKHKIHIYPIVIRREFVLYYLEKYIGLLITDHVHVLMMKAKSFMMRLKLCLLRKCGKNKMQINHLE